MNHDAVHHNFHQRKGTVMKQRSIRWLRNLTANKITVLGKIGAYLIFENRTDLIDQAAALQGDAFEPHDDRFTFSSYAAQGRLLHPLMPVEPLYTVTPANTTTSIPSTRTKPAPR